MQELKDINGVFIGVFSCWHVACDNAGQTAYSQLRLHITGEYNHRQAGISSQTTEYVACRPAYIQRVSLVLAHSLTKVRNFEHVASETQHKHAAAFSCLHERCYVVKVPTCSESKRLWKHPYFYKNVPKQ